MDPTVDSSTRAQRGPPMKQTCCACGSEAGWMLFPSGAIIIFDCFMCGAEYVVKVKR